MLRFWALYLLLWLGAGAQKNDENCETLMSEIHITKGSPVPANFIHQKKKKTLKQNKII